MNMMNRLINWNIKSTFCFFCCSFLLALILGFVIPFKERIIYMAPPFQSSGSLKEAIDIKVEVHKKILIKKNEFKILTKEFAKTNFKKFTVGETKRNDYIYYLDNFNFCGGRKSIGVTRFGIIQSNDTLFVNKNLKHLLDSISGFNN